MPVAIVFPAPPLRDGLDRANRSAPRLLRSLKLIATAHLFISLPNKPAADFPMFISEGHIFLTHTMVRSPVETPAKTRPM